MEIITQGQTLELSGDFDVRSTGQVRHAIYQHLGSLTEANVVIDLTGVRYVDVTALRVLAVATMEATRQGHHLTLRGCGPAIRRMLHISRLIRVVEVEREAATA